MPEVSTSQPCPTRRKNSKNGRLLLDWTDLDMKYIVGFSSYQGVGRVGEPSAASRCGWGNLLLRKKTPFDTFTSSVRPEGYSLGSNVSAHPSTTTQVRSVGGHGCAASVRPLSYEPGGSSSTTVQVSGA